MSSRIRPPARARWSSRSRRRECAAATSSSTAPPSRRRRGRSGSAGTATPNIAGHEPCGVVVARGEGVSEERGPGRRPGDGAPLQGVRVVRALPGRVAAALPGRVHCLRSDRRRGARRLHEDPGLDPRCRCRTSSRTRPESAIACGTGTAFGALKRVHLTGSDTIAIFGQGPVGLSATQFAHAMGARVIALDTDRRAARARQGASGRTKSSTREATIRWPPSRS